jgi:translation elongation factor EF-1beta
LFKEIKDIDNLSPKSDEILDEIWEIIVNLYNLERYDIAFSLQDMYFQKKQKMEGKKAEHCKEILDNMNGINSWKIC